MSLPLINFSINVCIYTMYLVLKVKQLLPGDPARSSLSLNQCNAAAFFRAEKLHRLHSWK